jgi:hypothetical protein
MLGQRLRSVTTAPNDTASVLRSMYAAEGNYLAAGGPGIANFATLAPYFAADIVLHQADALPYGGVWRGHDGVEQFFVAMSQTWEAFEMVEQAFLSTTGTAVVLTQVHARARATDETPPQSPPRALRPSCAGCTSPVDRREVNATAIS